MGHRFSTWLRDACHDVQSPHDLPISLKSSPTGMLLSDVPWVTSLIHPPIVILSLDSLPMLVVGGKVSLGSLAMLVVGGWVSLGSLAMSLVGGGVFLDSLTMLLVLPGWAKVSNDSVLMRLYNNALPMLLSLDSLPMFLPWPASVKSLDSLAMLLTRRLSVVLLLSFDIVLMDVRLAL